MTALAPVRIRINVPLTEEFVGEQNYGRFDLLQAQTTSSSMGNAGNSTYPWGLSTQNHIDIRTFNPANAQYPENWVNNSGLSFTLGPQTFLNNWNAMVATVLGFTTFTSIAGNLNLTSLGTRANVILALPNFPLVYVDPATTYLEFSSDGFISVASVSLAQSTTTIINGDSVATWPISLFTGTDLTKITGVRLRFQTYDAATVMMAGLRLVDPSWHATSVDFDNWNGAMRQCIPPNAARGVFPVGSNLQIPTLWYAAPTTGIDDPQPINTTMGIVFNTGSMLFSNSFTVCLRAVGGTDVSQLTLNGMTQATLNGPQPYLSTSAELPRHVSELEGIPVKQLTGQSMLNLSARQANIAESWINYNVQWGTGIPSVGITKSSTGQGYTWNGNAASAIGALSPRTFYLCLISIQDTTAQLQILNLNQQTFAIIAPSQSTITGPPSQKGIVFDTGPINDSYLFPRRPGRIGWQTNLLDGDAQIRALRPHALTYAEWRSTQLNSNTPVNGARLYVQSAPHEQLWTSWTPRAGQYNTKPLLNADTSRTLSGSSTKVTIQNGAAVNQGVISNVLSPPESFLTGIVDWTNSQLDFDVWFPATGLQNPLSGYLLSQDGAQIPLVFPAITPNQWQSIVAYPPTLPTGYLTALQSGRYQLVLIYTGTQPLSFWIDNVSLIERTVTWDARANITDPWTTFGDLIASDNAGLLFNKGTALQIRGVAHRQDDVILSSPQIMPVYADLGRLVWPEEVKPDPQTLTLGPIWTATQSAPGVNHVVQYQAQPNAWAVGTTYQPGQIVGKFNANLALSKFYVALSITTGNDPATDGGVHWQQVALWQNQGIVNYQWSMGDGGVATGRNVYWAYAAAGSYTVTLTITDAYGTQATYSGVQAVT